MKKTHVILYAFCAAGLLLFLVSLFLYYSHRELELSLALLLTKQEQKLLTLSELSNSYRGDEVTESIITDCSPQNRQRFETLLNRLATLSTTELIEIEPLFDACAAFFAERKALSVARLEQEFEVYRSYLDLYALTSAAHELAPYQLDVWQRLVELENERKTALHELVSIQREIIDALKEVPKDSAAIESLVVRARQINEQTASLNAQVRDTRTQLQAL